MSVVRAGRGLRELTFLSYGCGRAARARARSAQEKDVLEEVDSMMSGGSWVDWDDNKSTTKGNKK